MTVLDIMRKMDSIEYGFPNKSGINLIDSDDFDINFSSFYYLQSPEDLISSKCGVCWDQVELERYYFKKTDFSYQTYFLYLDDGDLLPSHTFLVYQDSFGYHWFEHSWEKYRGIHSYQKLSLLLQDVVDKFCFDYPALSNIYSYKLYLYTKPKYHISCDEFYKFIYTQKRINL